MSRRCGRWSRTRDKRLLDYAYLCAEEALDPGFFDECINMLARDYDGIVAIVDYDVTGQLTAIHQAGLADEALAAYKSHYHRTNVYVNAVEQFHLENETTNFERYISADELHRSEYYSDFLRPMRVEHIMALGLKGEKAARTSVSIYRLGGGEAFDREEVRCFDRLRPFIKSALTMRKLAADRKAAPAGSAETESTVAAFPRPADAPDRLHSKWGLTPRETEVALALAEGLSYKEVALKLGLSFHTVNDYIDSLHRKMNLSTARIIAVLNRR